MTSRDTPSLPKTIASASSLLVMDVIFRRLLKKLAISFPSSLAGCGVLFATLLLSPGDGLYKLLSPGAALLAKWLPVFFVPSLVTLPLADSLGSAGELLKVGVVIVGGFYFTLLTTAWSVMAVRKLGSSPGSNLTKNEVADEKDIQESVTKEKAEPPPKAFSESTAKLLRAFTAISAGAALVASTGADGLAEYANPLSALFLLFATLNNFVFGARFPKTITKVIHPLVTCTTLTWLYAKLLGVLTGKSFMSVISTYKTGTLNPLFAGAGDVLLFLLGPAVVSLACQMYDRRKLMRENVAEVGTAVSVSALGGLFGTAGLVRLLGVGNPSIRLCLLSRNITSPLAMAIASILGADVSLAVTMVVVTGLIGANFGASILDSFGIKDAVARGLGIGAAAHGLGTAAFANEKDAFPFAAIAMALTASACTVLVSVPFLKRAILQLALG